MTDGSRGIRRAPAAKRGSEGMSEGRMGSKLSQGMFHLIHSELFRERLPRPLAEPQPNWKMPLKGTACLWMYTSLAVDRGSLL